MPDIPSLQIQIDADMEKLLMETVIEQLNSAEAARREKDYGKDAKGVTLTFDQKLQLLKDMFYGNRPSKSVPWVNCSNRSMKIAMAIVEMLHARILPAVWNEDLIRWRPTERTDKEKVERINKLMVWWIKVYTRMREFFDKWVKTNIGYGDSFVEGSWEIDMRDTGQFNETPILDEFGIQLFNKDGTPSVNKEKIFRTIEKTKIEIIPKENVYFQKNQTDIQKDTVIIKLTWLYSQLEQLEAEEKAVNISEPLHSNNDTLRLKLMNILNETVSSSYNQENVETIKEAKLRQTPVDILKAYLKLDIDRDGFSEDVRVLIDPLRRIYLGGVAVKDLSKRGIRPIDFCKVNNLLEAPDALEGYGILEMVLPLAQEIDAIFNQITDANTLSVLRPGFYDPSGSLQPQTITLAPNRLIPVPDPQRNIYFPDISIPIERLIVALRGVLEFIERLTGASAYVMGKESEIVGGSGTATRTQAIVMASEIRFATPTQRLRAGASRILNIILDLVQLNIPPGLENRILGEDDEPIFSENELTAEGISGEYDAYILEDMAMGSADIERQLSIFLYQMLLQNPIVATDPVKIYNETANLLKAHKQDPVEHLGQPPQEKDVDTPEDENTLILQGDFARVRAILTENHMHHIVVHQNLFQSPTLATLQPGAMQLVAEFVKAHIQEHTMMMQQMLTINQKYGKQISPTQANAGIRGMENIPGPLGPVAERKEQGASQFSPTMQP